MQSVNPPDPASLLPDSRLPVIDLNRLHVTLQGDDTHSVTQAEALRAAFPGATVSIAKPHSARTTLLRRRNRTEIAVYVFAALALMVVGHLLFGFLTVDRLTLLAHSVPVTKDILYYVLGGFIAQMIDGALGMAYGVTASTFLLAWEWSIQIKYFFIREMVY